MVFMDAAQLSACVSVLEYIRALRKPVFTGLFLACWLAKSSQLIGQCKFREAGQLEFRITGISQTADRRPGVGVGQTTDGTGVCLIAKERPGTGVSWTPDETGVSWAADRRQLDSWGLGLHSSKSRGWSQEPWRRGLDCRLWDLHLFQEAPSPRSL